MLFPTTEPSRCCLLHTRSRWWSLQLHSSWNRARFMSTYLLLDPNLPIGWKILDLNIWSLSWASKGGWGGGKGSGRRMGEEIGGWGRKWGRELWWGRQPWQHEFFILSNGEGCVDSFCFFLLWRLAIFVLLGRRRGGGREDTQGLLRIAKAIATPLVFMTQPLSIVIVPATGGCRK